MENSAVKYQPLKLITPVPAWIDIDEPILIDDNLPSRTRFRYKVGDPIATAFDLKFYLSVDDAKNERNAWIDTDHFLSYEISPAVPAAESAADEEQVGYLSIETLQSVPHDSVYGRIFICQPLTLIGNPKLQSVSPIRSPRRRFDPTWETK